MPFICVLTKSIDSASAQVDDSKLATLLCPYHGEINTYVTQLGVLNTSSLAQVNQQEQSMHCLIPSGSQKNAQTPWLEIQLSAHQLSFTTDPLGTFPLWYVEDGERVIITSEVKSIMALSQPLPIELDKSRLSNKGKRPANFSPYKNINRLSPGAKLIISPDCDIHEEGGLPLTYAPADFFIDTQASCSALSSALLKSAKDITGQCHNVGTFLSGGIDSSTATALMQHSYPDLQTYTLGTQYGDEYADALELSNYLSLDQNRICASSDDAIKHFKRAVFCNETVDGLTAETLAQLSILSEAASASVTKVITGYGADLLFGSMLRHKLYMQVTGVNDLQSLIERTCWSGEFSPFFAWSLGIELHHLFWDPELMNTAFKIPSKTNFDNDREKLPLRKLAVDNGWMLEQHAFRKKHAMTDGTQFNRVLAEAYQLNDSYAYSKKDDLCLSYLEELYRS